VRSFWQFEASWISGLVLVALLAGKISGAYLAAFTGALALYLLRHILHLYRLLAWLRSGKRKMPLGSGLWEEIYYLLYRLMRRNKRRKKRLLHMLERFQTATAALPDATVVLGVRNEIIWFNDAAITLLGLRKSDVGQQVINLVRFPQFVEFLRQPQPHTQLDSVDIASPVLMDARLQVRIVPYGEGLRLLVAQDVTQLRFMERVRSDFVANVSHELRTPLTVLKGYLETLEDAQDQMPRRYFQIFKRMNEQTRRMQYLIDDLLMLTRLESDHKPRSEDVPVPDILREICDETALMKEEHAPITLEIATQAHITGDKSLLYSAFSNLIVNALKYTPAQGRITVRWLQDEAGLRMEVEDNGPGIALEHLPRITERFYRVEIGGVSNKDGTGLGLAIVKHVLSRHNAELKIRSKPGKGSCFGCYFLR